MRLFSDAALASFGAKTTPLGAASAIYGWWTANEIAAIGGLAVAILGFLMALYFGIRREMRERTDAVRRAELHALKVEAIKRGLAVADDDDDP